MKMMELILAAAAVLNTFEGEERAFLKKAIGRSIHMAIGDKPRWN